MEQHIPQDKIRRIIISDMVKKRNTIVHDSTLISMKECRYYGLTLLSQYFKEQECFLDDFMDFVGFTTEDKLRLI